MTKSESMFLSCQMYYCKIYTNEDLKWHARRAYNFKLSVVSDRFKIKMGHFNSSTV